MSRSETSQNSKHGKKKIKKKRGPPADEETLFTMINELRMQMGLHELKVNNNFAPMATTIINDESPMIEEADFVVMSLMYFWDSFDGKQSAKSLLEKWMNEPNRRPVVLAPGKYGKLLIQETEDEAYSYIVLIVASIYR